MLVLPLLTTLWAVVAAHEFYNESLSLRPLPRNALLAEFDFSIKSSPKPLIFHNQTSAGDASHYTYFPRSIGPILEQSNTRELHLRFGQGWWDPKTWGQLPKNGSSVGGTGVEVWGIVEAPSSKIAFEQWRQLVNALSGLFCASINFVDEKITTFPINSFVDDHASFTADETNTLYLLRAALPSEPICTENLTPFLKMLPTRGRAGVSSLLDGHKVFDSLWNSMSVDITTECQDDGCVFRMDQTVAMVIDILRSIRKQEEGTIPKPVSGDKLRCDLDKDYDSWKCFPLPPTTQIGYDLETLFGRKIKGSAFETETSVVNIHIDPDHWQVKTFKDDTEIHIVKSYEHTVVDILGPKPFNIELSSADSTNVLPVVEPPLLVSRSLTGYSQDKGGFRVVFSNAGDAPVKFTYFESLPWFVRLYLNTMSAELKLDGTNSQVPLVDYVTLSYFQPALDRERPSHMELEVEVPANSQLALNYKFDKSLLLYSEYPPDANHGFSVEPAVITILDQDNRRQYQLRTTSSLITLPTPDFSMPYNVIILTCTVMSLAFGSVFSLLTKTVVTEEEAEKIAAQSNLGKLKAVIKYWVARLKQRK